jgi:aryl-alcohol dehydrogenase-like predicted oxidoreductase
MFARTRALCMRAFATAEGTRQFLTQRYPNPTLLSYCNKASSSAGNTSNNSNNSNNMKKLQMSTIGFGSYRTGIEDRNHQFALQMAIQSGVNVIDTSTNYMNGDSELMIGTVLNGMIQDRIIDRENIVLMTKIGYIQQENMNICREREAQGRPFVGIVKVQENWHWHCISPDFLSDQLSRSLDRLQLDTVDVLYLHNPEYVWSENDNHAAFYEKIEHAFEYLEHEVQQGRIQYYGISSNTFIHDPNMSGNVSLVKCHEIAEKIAGKNNHHFKFVQFPFNIEENNAAFLRNCNGQTLLQYAKSNGLITVGNRPFNTIVKDNIVRYVDSLRDADLEEECDTKLKEWTQLLNQAIYMEVNTPFDRNTLSDSGSNLADPKMPHKAGVSWANILAANLDQLDSLYAFRETMLNRIRPEVSYALQKIRSHPKGEQYASWASQYNYLLNSMLSAYDKYLTERHQREVNEIKVQMDKICPDLSFSKLLAQKTLRVLCSTGIDIELVGMRSTNYVKDITQMGPMIPEEKAMQILQSVKWNFTGMNYEQVSNTAATTK